MAPAAEPRETEVKFRLKDRDPFEERLSALGAVPGPEEQEDNVLWDDPEGSLRRGGSVLRLRTSGGQVTVTLKGKAVFTEGVKSRLELETTVGSAEVLAGILRQLGLLPVFRYEKRRTTWRFPQPARPEIVVDETPLGLFAEIEGEEGAILVLARELGVSAAEFLADSYVSLWQKARAADPTLPVDMRF